MLPTPTPTPPGSRAVCLDVGAQCRQPELGRWFPRKEAGEKWASPASLGESDPRCTPWQALGETNQCLGMGCLPQQLCCACWGSTYLSSGKS